MGNKCVKNHLKSLLTDEEIRFILHNFIRKISGCNCIPKDVINLCLLFCQPYTIGSDSEFVSSDIKKVDNFVVKGNKDHEKISWICFNKPLLLNVWTTFHVIFRNPTLYKWQQI